MSRSTEAEVRVKAEREAESESDSIVGAEAPVWESARRFHRTEQGLPLVFHDRPYLEGMFRMWPWDPRDLEVVWKKVPQEGVSELALAVAFFYAGEIGARVWYVLPKFDSRNEFVQTRVNHNLHHTERWRRRMNEAAVPRDAVAMKAFAGGGFLKFVGSNVRNEFLSHPCDIGILDELNECDLENVALIDDRMGGHTSRRVWLKISTPTTSGRGISAEYDRSDRRKWFIPCPHCGTWQTPDWWKNVVEPDSRPDTWKLRDSKWRENSGRDILLLCADCGHPMDRMAMGEWRAERPERTTIGFHISKLFSAARSIRACFRRFVDWQEAMKPAAGQVFFNSVLGDDYTGGTIQVTEDLLRYCASLDPYRMPERSAPRCVAGVDVGKDLHWVVDHLEGGRRRAVHVGRTAVSVEKIREYVRRFSIHTLVIDARPEAKFVSDVKAALNTDSSIRVYSCDYQKDKIIRPVRDSAEAIVKIDRTLALDESKADMDVGARLLPAEVMELDRGDFKTSMCKPTRIEEKAPNGDVRSVWTKETDDHYRHADTYAWIASTLLPPEAPVDWGEDLTRSKEDDRSFQGPEAQDEWGLGLGDFEEGGRHF